MNGYVDSFAYWLADYYLATTALLAVALVALRVSRQPVKRLAVAKASIVALAVLAGLLAVPGWSVFSLKSTEATQSAAAVEAAPVVTNDIPQRSMPAVSVFPEPVVIRPVENTSEMARTVHEPTSLPKIALAAYLLGSAVVAFWLVLGSIAASRLVRRAQSAPASLNGMLKRDGGNCVRGAKLLISDEIGVAVAIGVWRPHVILPHAWATRRLPEELSAVLAHEVAHVENGDLVWLAIGRLMLIVLWAQPLYWLLRRAVRLDQEALADAAAAELSDRRQYAEQLVAWAREMSQRQRLPLQTAMGLWEGPSQLRRRVALLLDEQFTLLANCPKGWRRGAALAVVIGAVSLSLLTFEPGHTAPSTDELEELSVDEQAQVATAIRVLRQTEGIGERPVAGLPVADDWAIAIRKLAEIGRPAVPTLIESLDEEQRDHPMSKLAFTLRAIGDPRAVPALIRAIPRTLRPGRNDYGLRIADPELLKFVQRHDLTSSNGGNHFQYGRAFREVVGALEKLTGTNQRDMELNWVHLGETDLQRRIQRKHFHDLAERWADWWLENRQKYDVDERYVEVGLTALEGEPIASVATTFPINEQLGLVGFWSQWIVEPARESGKRCFVDLDTARQGDWRLEPEAAAELGLASQQASDWARKEGFDLAGVRLQPEGFDSPIYCLQPLGLKVWEITPHEQRELLRAMRGEIPYPLGKPVDLLVPRQVEYSGPDKFNLGGTAFLFLTSEGTAGLLRMTAQVTDTRMQIGRRSTRDDQFSSKGFYRGAKISFAIMAETDEPQAPVYSDRAMLTVQAFAPGGPPQAPVMPETLKEVAVAVTAGDTGTGTDRDVESKSAEAETQHVVVGGGAVDTFVASNSATPWDYEPNVLALDVQDEAGKPIEGVEAIVYRVSPQAGQREVVKRATTNARGEVEFTGLVDAKRAAEFKERAAKSQFPLVQGDSFYTVLQRAGLTTAILPRSDFQIAGRGVKHGVRMWPAAELSGLVTDSAGKPVAGATVVAGGIAGYFAVEGVNAVRTDADGRFTFTNLPAFSRATAIKRTAEQNQGALHTNRDLSKMYPLVFDPAEDTSISDLVAKHPDYAVTTVRGGDVPGTADVVMQPAAAIEGRVVVFGTEKPAAGIQIKASGTPIPIDADVLQSAGDGPQLFLNDVHHAATRTDAEGRYRLANLPAGTYEVWAQQPSNDWREIGWVSTNVADLRPTPGQEALQAPDLVIGPGGTIHGHLVEAKTGQRVVLADKNARVRAMFHFVDGVNQQQAQMQEVPMADDGSFTLSTFPAKARIFVDARKGLRLTGSENSEYRSPDDFYRTGQVFDLAHGKSVDAEFPVMSAMQLDDVRNSIRLGFDVLQTKDKDKAIQLFTHALANSPNESSALAGRAQAYESSGQFAGAIGDYEKLAELEPKAPMWRNNLAGLLATSPNEADRDGARAVELAKRAIEQAQGVEAPPTTMANLHDTLAAAQAEVGDFQAAVATQHEAIEKAAEGMRAEMRKRLKAYESGKAWRRTATSG